MKVKKEKGFTLIELLVSIMIIGVLAGVMLRTLNIRGVQSKSRDGQRQSDLKKIQVALEGYYTDYRTYPNTGETETWVKITGTDSLSTAMSVTNRYLSEIPLDPVGQGATSGENFCDPDEGPDVQDYFYKSVSGTGKYVIIALMEVESSAEDHTCSTVDVCNPEVARCYEVRNP